MPHIKEYIALRARLNDALAEIKEHNEAITALSDEVAKIEDQMYDLENFDLTDADLAKIGECDRLGVDP